MSKSLKNFFSPNSIAVIGASNRPNSVGRKVFENILRTKFPGKLYPVNPKHKQIQNYDCFPTIKDITQPIDLAVIVTPANTVAAILTECGEKGIPAVLIISAGFSETGKEGKNVEKSLLEIAKKYNIRLMGPNCLGLMRPHSKLNVTFDNNIPFAGNVALISQSGALCAAILDWAVDKQIGFSTLVSLGNSIDVDFSDILDYLKNDKETKAILLYIEGIHHGTHFMNALRKASAVKPVIVIKAGRYSQGSRAALTHTGALIGNDDIFDAALRQTGAVRVTTIQQLFSAAEILSSHYRISGNKLIIITNGGGAGVMAADQASELNISLPVLNEKTISNLNKLLPAHWSHQNPIDLIGDATPERYHSAIETCLKHEKPDGLLVILVPVAMSNPQKVADQIISDIKKTQKPILTCWMGEKQVKDARKAFETHHIPSFNTPEEAIEAFSYLANYHLNQKLLAETEQPLYFEPLADLKSANKIIENALAEKRRLLTTVESKRILSFFSIPVALPIEASTVDETIAAAKSIGFPVVIKINSPEITHKQDVGGVQLNIKSEEEVMIAFNKIADNLKKFQPDASMTGVTVEKMVKTENDRELLIGIKNDIVFGPAITFGAGGTLVEIMQDRAIALPPLTTFQAKQLISRTKISKLLGNFRHMPAVNIDHIVKVLLHVSQIAIQLPLIDELDINPLIANENEVIVIDARIAIKIG